MATFRRRILQYFLDAAGEVYQSPLSALAQRSSESAAEFVYSHLASETSVFSNETKMREKFFSSETLTSHPGLLLDFGVLRGRSTLQIAKAIPPADSRKLHAFDAFEGLRDPWSKVDRGVGSMNLSGKVPSVLLQETRIEVHVGWVEETLEPFLRTHPGQIGLAHFDFDVYPPTGYALERLISRLEKGSLLVFDDYFGFIGWENHSHRAFTENINIEDWTLVGVSPKQAAFEKK